MKHNTQKITNSKLNVEYYGADFPVDTLVKRMETEDFIIPNFQRGYVWKEEDASRFIESLLLGLPTPSLFLAKDKFSSKYLVIDGQQRLRTLQYFYRGFFETKDNIFKLKKVAAPYNSLTYGELPPSEKRSLDNTIIHCIIISDTYDPRGMFYVFERLNTTGIELTSQEIRNGLYNGAFSQLLNNLSQHETWKKLHNKSEQDFVEEELLLRFLAFYFFLDKYQGNIVDFLNSFMLENKDLEVISKSEIVQRFIDTIEFLKNCIGEKVFYPLPNKKFYVSFYDVLMLFTAKKINQGLDCETFKKVYETFIQNHKIPLLHQFPINKRIEEVEEIYNKMHP